MVSIKTKILPIIRHHQENLKSRLQNEMRSARNLSEKKAMSVMYGSIRSIRKRQCYRKKKRQVELKLHERRYN